MELERQTMEIERQVASESVQALVRAEATVSGAGREAVEPLMEEATLSIGAVEVAGRARAAGRHGALPGGVPPGRGGSPRALTAQAQFKPGRRDARGQARMIASVFGRWSTWRLLTKTGAWCFRWRSTCGCRSRRWTPST